MTSINVLFAWSFIIFLFSFEFQIFSQFFLHSSEYINILHDKVLKYFESMPCYQNHFYSTIHNCKYRILFGLNYCSISRDHSNVDLPIFRGTAFIFKFFTCKERIFIFFTKMSQTPFSNVPNPISIFLFEFTLVKVLFSFM